MGVRVCPTGMYCGLMLTTRHTNRATKCTRASESFAFGTDTTRSRGDQRICILIVKRATHTYGFKLCNCREGAAPLLSGVRKIMAFASILARSGAARGDIPVLLSTTSTRSCSYLCERGKVVATFGRTKFRATFFSGRLPGRSFVSFLKVRTSS